VDVRDLGTSIAVSLEGHIDLNVAQLLETELTRVIVANPERNLILNLQAVHYVSSSGLRVFIALTRILEREHRTLKLCSLSVALKRVFQVVGLSEYFVAYESEDDAAAAP